MIEREGKGGKPVACADHRHDPRHPLAAARQHERFVFTFVAERTIDKVIHGKRYRFVKGERYPMTRDGIRRSGTIYASAPGSPVPRGFASTIYAMMARPKCCATPAI